VISDEVAGAGSISCTYLIGTTQTSWYLHRVTHIPFGWGGDSRCASYVVLGSK
jgi:hypothetical protein